MAGYSQDYTSLIKNASDRASSLAQSSGELAAQLPNIGDLIKQKATAAYQNNQDIIQPLDKATQAYYAAPATARDTYQNIFNPFSREKLVTQAVGNASLPMLSLASILGQRLGSISDIIRSGTGAFQSQVTAQQAQATAAQQALDNIFKQYGIETQNIQAENAAALEKQKLAESQREFDISQAAATAARNASSTSNQLDLSSILGAYGANRPPLSSFNAVSAPAGPVYGPVRPAASPPTPLTQAISTYTAKPVSSGSIFDNLANFISGIFNGPASAAQPAYQSGNYNINQNTAGLNSSPFLSLGGF